MSKINVTDLQVHVSNFQQAYNDLGLGPVSAETTVSNALSRIETALIETLTSKWPVTYAPIISHQEESAIMAPWSANIPETAPQCVINAITTDLETWALPVEKHAIKIIAEEITMHISNHGESTGTFYGKTQLTSSEVIQWGVGFTTSVIMNEPRQKGIIYAFTAVLEYN